MKMKTLEEYREDPALTSAARKVLDSKPMLPMLHVLENALPTNRALPPMGSDTNDFIYAYGVEVGYRQCLATLKLMAMPKETPGEVESTFADNNNEE